MDGILLQHKMGYLSAFTNVYMYMWRSEGTMHVPPIHISNLLFIAYRNSNLRAFFLITDLNKMGKASNELTFFFTMPVPIMVTVRLRPPKASWLAIINLLQICCCIYCQAPHMVQTDHLPQERERDQATENSWWPCALAQSQHLHKRIIFGIFRLYLYTNRR